MFNILGSCGANCFIFILPNLFVIKIVNLLDIKKKSLIINYILLYTGITLAIICLLGEIINIIEY